MIFLFTKSDKVGSKLIRWGLSTDISHLAILEDYLPDDLSLVIESRMLTGVDITWLRSFEKHSTIVKAYRAKEMEPLESVRLFQKVSLSIGGADYDIKGVGFLAASVIICIKLLGKELPTENKWADKDDFYCSETLRAIKKELLALGVNLDKFANQMVTPDRAEFLFKNSPFFEDVTHLF